MCEEVKDILKILWKIKNYKTSSLHLTVPW